MAEQRIERGEDLLRVVLRRSESHMRQGRSCVACGKDCGRVALQQLAYVFEVCNCGTPDYQHLVECLQHRHGCPT